MPPDSYNLAMASRTIAETLDSYERVDGDEWLKREKTDDKILCITLRFSRAIALASYFCRSYHTVVYFVCRAVQLSLQKGICKHTALSFVQFAGVVTKDGNALSC